MQKKIINAFRSTGSLCIVLVVGVLLMSGCENPGSVGGGLREDNTEIAIDTFAVDAINTSQFNWYSGAYSYFSAGSFNDPLFGSLDAIGMLKPRLPVIPDSIDIGAGTEVKMRIIMNDEQFYGDQTSPQQFEVYPISELWRSKAWKLKDDIQFDASQKVAEFVVTDEDSLDITLGSTWVQTYLDFAQDTSATSDSTYKYEAYGLAIVPTNTSKVIPINSGSTRFVIETASDTLEASLARWAYSFDRGNSTLPPSSLPLHSTYESVLSFDLNLSEMDIQKVGISKAELVIYANTSALQSSLPASAERPATSSAQLYIANPEFTPENIAMSDPVSTGTYSEDDNAYHFTITSIVQRILLDGIAENQEFYITFSNNGMIRSTLLFDESGPADKAPKLIITSLKNSN
ncbi:MAG TPA: hypothetical protein VFG39_04195 [Balneolaceae bacterium]|nr:hypothetical protein [Balneolaceae bacterium]